MAEDTPGDGTAATGFPAEPILLDVAAAFVFALLRLDLGYIDAGAVALDRRRQTLVRADGMAADGQRERT